MHIAINTTPLQGGHKLRGIGVYTHELIASLKRFETKHSYTLFTRTTDIPNDCDIVHYPFFDPFFLTLPLIKTKPTVVTVHDLIPLLFPQHFPRGMRGEIKWQIQRFSLRNVARIIADSQATKKDATSLIPFAPAHIDVVPLAARDSFRPVADPKKYIAVSTKYDLSDRFVLYVGDVNWNKNVIGLISAWANLVREGALPKGTKLVLVGKAFLDTNLAEANHVKDVIHEYHIADVVQMVGYVPDEDLKALYTYATACVFPSYYEGFGLTVLEAMACGAVCVVSDISSLSEIIGPAIGIDPHRVESISLGIKKGFFLPPDRREAMAQKSIMWAKAFTWQNVAKETVRTYEKVVG